MTLRLTLRTVIWSCDVVQNILCAKFRSSVFHLIFCLMAGGPSPFVLTQKDQKVKCFGKEPFSHKAPARRPLPIARCCTCFAHDVAQASASANQLMHLPYAQGLIDKALLWPGSAPKHAALIIFSAGMHFYPPNCPNVLSEASLRIGK